MVKYVEVKGFCLCTHYIFNTCIFLYNAVPLQWTDICVLVYFLETTEVLDKGCIQIFTTLLLLQ